MRHTNLQPNLQPLQSLLRLLLASTLGWACAQAQTLPDAGSLERQFERSRPPQLPSRGSADKIVPPTAEAAPDAVRVTVRQFEFAGNTLVSSPQLAAVVAPYLNRPLTFTQLNAAAAAVATYYRDAGWVVRAYLPAQDVQNGSVRMQIVEAVFGQARVASGSAQRVSSRQIEGFFQSQQQRGTVLRVDALDRALLLADDLPGVVVAGTMAAGQNERETDLLLQLGDEALATGDANIDNTGTRSTGSDRLAVNLSLNSPMGMGDLLNANLLTAQGSNYVRVAYSVPVGYDGWRAGVNASSMRYKIVEGAFAGLNAEGTSRSTGLEARYPLVRARQANLFLQLNYDRRDFDNLTAGASTTRYQTDDYTTALFANAFDDLAGGGANSASIAFTSGTRSNSMGSSDQSWRKLNYSVSRQQTLTQNLSVVASVSGQEASNPLDSSEKFYLGGASGVRAYPSSEGSGDSGTLTTLELRWRLPGNLVWSVFHDYGQVRNETAPSYALQGAGMALAWQSESGFTVRATVSSRIGDNPNPTPTGHDQDGSLDINRFWLSVSASF